MCSKMKGQLKSRFIVLNDDRVLPPPPQSGVAGVSHHRGRGRGGRGGRGAGRGSFQGKGVKRTQDLSNKYLNSHCMPQQGTKMQLTFAEHMSTRN